VDDVANVGERREEYSDIRFELDDVNRKILESISLSRQPIEREHEGWTTWILLLSQFLSRDQRMAVC